MRGDIGTWMWSLGRTRVKCMLSTFEFFFWWQFWNCLSRNTWSIKRNINIINNSKIKEKIFTLSIVILILLNYNRKNAS